MTAKTRVLVVEDDDDLRETLNVILSDEGFDVLEAAHGGEALDALASDGRTDVILLDLLMPVLDGWATLEALRANPSLAHLPVIVCTSAPERAPAGVPVLSKPLDLDALLAAIARHRAA